MSIMDYAGPGDTPDPTTAALLSAATQKPTRQDFESLLSNAENALQDAVDAAQDPGEKATLSQCVNAIHKMQAAHQALTDRAMGAGPGAQFVRKTAGG